MAQLRITVSGGRFWNKLKPSTILTVPELFFSDNGTL
jgi:hypothetical protein